jgi:hypothetical protein
MRRLATESGCLLGSMVNQRDQLESEVGIFSNTYEESTTIQTIRGFVQGTAMKCFVLQNRLVAMIGKSGKWKVSAML